ncbi:MAG TPA: 2OG-Fe(II) oxygenase [Blastocatellia bacterium]|nr:2OG-Fe(II) oxygenase [Blastocatellia bacterium]
MIDFERIEKHKLHSVPYAWAHIDSLFTPEDAGDLASTFPQDQFKTVIGNDGEKEYEYEARELIAMRSDRISHADELSPAWQQLARDLLSSNYRRAMSSLTGCDLTSVDLEVNAFHYGPNARLGAHADLKDKIVTHVLYFNDSWNLKDGGCLSILRSMNPADVVTQILPVVGNSAVLVRSDNSWHSVSRVVSRCQVSRRSLTATFYHPGSVSTMWPPGDTTPLHTYKPPEFIARPGLLERLWRALAPSNK